MAKRFHRACIWLALGLVLGIHRGYIALWQTGDSTPSIVYPYKAALLPTQEVERLTAGIPVRDAEHLQLLLTDYLS